jgi:Fic family protein
LIFQTPPISFEEVAAREKIDELWRKLRFQVAEQEPWVRQVSRLLSARAIQGSSGLDGYDVSLETVLAAIGEEETTGATAETRGAVSGYQRALAYVRQLAQDEHFQYTPQLLRGLQFMMAECAADTRPGLWRSRPGWIRDHTTGEIVYEGPPHREIPGLIEELTNCLSADNDAPVVVVAAMAHLNLVMIGPFGAANGGMARCLQTLVLAREQPLAPALSSIEEYLGQNTCRYRKVLAEVGGETWQPRGDARPWVRFCLEAHFIQASSALRRVRESEAIWRRLDAICAEKHLPSRMVSALFDATVGISVRNASYRVALRTSDQEISHQGATDDLRAMVNAGLLARFGSRRGTYYRAAEPLDAIRQQVRQSRRPISAGSLFAVTD